MYPDDDGTYDISLSTDNRWLGSVWVDRTDPAVNKLVLAYRQLQGRWWKWFNRADAVLSYGTLAGIAALAATSLATFMLGWSLAVSSVAMVASMIITLLGFWLVPLWKIRRIEAKRAQVADQLAQLCPEGRVIPIDSPAYLLLANRVRNGLAYQNPERVNKLIVEYGRGTWGVIDDMELRLRAALYAGKIDRA